MRQQGFELNKELLELLPADTVAVALTGSNLYNLATNNSDYDIVAITKGGKPKQTIKNGQDIVITPYKIFMNRVLDNAVPECLMIASGKILVLDENYRPILESLNFSYYQLIKKLNEYSYKYLNFMYEGKRMGRLEKTFKTILRNSMIVEKVLNEGIDFTPFFNEEEREEFYSTLPILIEKFNNNVGKSEMMEFLNIPKFTEAEKSRK